MAESRRSGDSSSRDQEGDRHQAVVDLELRERLRYKIDFLYFQLASPEEQIMMVEPLGWRPEIPPVDPQRLLRFLRARLAEGGAGKGIPHF
jgi:hypothetical protein